MNTSKTKIIVKEIIWHLRNAMTKKVAILPFTAPCYLYLYFFTFFSFYLDDFLQTIMLKTQIEREAFVEKQTKQREIMNSKSLYAFYSLTATLAYLYIFGFSMDLTGLQVLNFPTYFLTAILFKIVSLIF